VLIPGKQLIGHYWVFIGEWFDPMLTGDKKTAASK